MLLDAKLGCRDGGRMLMHRCSCISLETQMLQHLNN